MKNYQRSDYIVDVKLEDTQKTLLIHGYTGAIDIVSDEFAEKIKNIKELNEETSPFSSTILESLIKRGYVTTKTKQEEQEYVKRMARVMHEDSKRMCRSFVFLVSYDCNFRCPYCYENTISESGNAWSKKTMTKELVDKAFEAIEIMKPTITKMPGKKLALYGGEPLLKQNYELVSYIVRRAREEGFTVYAVTNGYDLDSYTEILGEDGLSMTQITIDGNKEIHDKRRFHYKEGTSFDKIIKNIEIALKKGIDISIRINIDDTNFNNIGELKSFFEEKGFFNYPKFSTYAALVTGNRISNPSLMDRSTFIEKMKNSNVGVRMQDYSYKDRVLIALKTKKAFALKPVFCGAQCGYTVFDPNGFMYPCVHIAGQTNNAAGIYGENLEYFAPYTEWNDRNIGKERKCSVCKYAFVCGGGCLAQIKDEQEFSNSPICKSVREMFSEAVNRAYQEYISE